jgi:hypothetical protein
VSNFAHDLTKGMKTMTINYPYYLQLSPSLYSSVRFLGITPKTDLLDTGERVQKKDKQGTPMWVVSALVKHDGANQETENFTLVAPHDVAQKYKQIEELTAVRLVGLSGGKWSRATSDQTAWTFQITGLEAAK